MAIEHAVDGSVREPGSDVLAGSALCLDQAVRNLVAWGFATPAEAIGLASANPAALLAPALATQGVDLAGGSVAWSPTLVPQQVWLGGVEYRVS